MGATLWQTESELEESFLRASERSGDLETGVRRLLETYLADEMSDVRKCDALARMSVQITTGQVDAPIEPAELDRLFRQPAAPACRSQVPTRDVTTLDDLARRYEGPGCVAIEDTRLLPSDSTVFVVGDTHGDADTTDRLLDQLRPRVRAGAFCVFLGDYVNNGLRSVANLVHVLRFKQECPDHVVLLGGNHEVRETYATAVREYFRKHWDRATSRPYLNTMPPRHYGHLRLELVTTYGAFDGEQLYRRFAEWGRSLPYAAFVPGRQAHEWTMLSHSIGLATALQTSDLSVVDLIGVTAPDRRLVETLGFEAWTRLATTGVETQHAAMVNNGHLHDDLLGHFGALGVARACVGHMHYRSGLEQRFGDVVVHTLCSSRKESPDAGHYMFGEMVVERMEAGGAGVREGLPRREATPCIAEIADGEVTVHRISESGIGDW